MIETVVVLRFSIDWDLKSSQRGGKAWKTTYIKQLCDVAMGQEMERINTNFVGEARQRGLSLLFKKFKGKYEKLVTARNQIRKLYLSVGSFRVVLRIFIDFVTVWIGYLLRSYMEDDPTGGNQTSISDVCENVGDTAPEYSYSGVSR